MSGINFDSYIEKVKKQEKSRKKIYKSMLKYVISQINAKLGTEKLLVQEIPVVSLEEETYNMLEAIDYIISKLLKNKNFKKILTDIKILNPNYLYLEWDIKLLRDK